MSDNPGDDNLVAPEVVEEREGRAREYDAYVARAAQIQQLESEILPLNKSAIFEALHAAGIARVVIEFDGSGDEGQVSGIDAFDAALTIVPIAKIRLTTFTVSRDDPARVPTAGMLHDALDTLAYDLLDSVRSGWGNDEGAFGQFTFEVAERSITLDFNERHVTSELSTYEL